jgi:hypothetical protein
VSAIDQAGDSIIVLEDFGRPFAVWAYPDVEGPLDDDVSADERAASVNDAAGTPGYEGKTETIEIFNLITTRPIKLQHDNVTPSFHTL